MLLQQIIPVLLLQLICVKVIVADTDNTPTPFSVGLQYQYSYSTEIVLKEADKFYFSATVFLSAYEESRCEEKEGVLMREDLFGALNCTSVHVRFTDTSLMSMQAKLKGYETIEHRLNFSQWFSFYQRQDGLISKVRYPEDEDRQVLQLKKGVTSSFSLRLHSYVRNKDSNKQYGGWTYRVPDLDHSGTHSARYEVQEKNRMVTYRKSRTDFENNHVHEKEIQIVKETGHIELVRVEDTAEISHSTNTESYSIEEPPPIQATGVSHINLVTKSDFDSLSIQEPAGLILDSIIAQRVEEEPILYRNAILQIQSNLSLTDNCYPRSTTECVKTIRNIVTIIELMREQDVSELSADYLSCPSRKKHTHVLSMLDAFGMCNRASCQSALVSFLNASCVELEMAFSILQHISTTNTPSLFTIDIMDQLAFHPSSFPIQLRNNTLSDMAVLSLGIMSGSLRDTDPLLSDRILSKLHRMVLPHDHERYRRDNGMMSRKVSSESVGLMRQSSLIHSLGNAGHENSFLLLKSYTESKHAPSLLRRSAVHSLRSYHTDEAAETMLSAALVDEEEVVRYEATIQYQRHPNADSMSDVLYDFYNYTREMQSPAGASKRRIRRFNIFDALSFHLATPSFNWKKTVGSTNFGASMGLIIINMMDLNIKPLSGKFEIDVHDEAYFVANLGYVGVTIDIFRARICFKGHIEYNLNILQELGINSFSDLANIYDKTIGAVVSAIKEAISSFRKALGTHIDVKYIFHTLVKAVSELPFIIENLVVSPTLRRILEQLKQLPFIQKGLTLIDEIKSLYSDVRSDVLMFYQEISDCVTVTLPWVGETIKTAITTIGKSIEHFFRNPIISIRDVIVSILQLRSAFDAVIDCKDVLINAAKFQGAHIRGWMDVVNRLKEIYNTTIETADLIIAEAKEFSEIRNISSFERATGLNLTTLRIKAYADLKNAFQEFIKPLAPLLDIVEPFINAFNSVVNVIKTAIKAYELLREKYEQVKNLIERLFGPKFNRNFPRQIRGEDDCKESKCECGYYPTTSGDSKVYKKGLQLEIESGEMLVAPTSGLYIKVPDNQVMIYPKGSFSKYVILIHNVEVLPNITGAGVSVDGGNQIGTVTDNPFGCEPNFIHFTMMTKSKGATTDPNPFLQPRFLEIPHWIQECNDYDFLIYDKVMKHGTIIGKPPDRKNQTARGTCKGKDICNNPDLPDNNDPPPQGHSAYNPKFVHAISGNTNSLLPNATSNGPRGPLDRPVGTNLGKFFTKEREEEYSKDGKDGKDGKSGFHIVVTGGGGEFNFSVNTIKVGQVLEILKRLTNPEVSHLITTLENTFEYIRKALDCSEEELTDPSLLDLETIQHALRIRGLPFQGDRDKLIAELIALPEDLCPAIQHAIPPNRWCTITQDCLTLKCAAALKLDFFKYSVSFSITLDPCAPSITLKFQDLEKVIHLPDIYGGSEINIGHESIEVSGLAKVELALRLTRKDSNVYLDFTAYLCPPDESSEDYSHCFYSIDLLAKAGFQIPSPFNCSSERKRREVTAPNNVTSCGIKIPDFLNMTLGEFVTYIKDFGDSGSASNSTNNLNQLMQDLRNVLLKELLDAIISGKSPITGDQTDFPTTFDVCIAGALGSQFRKNFFRISKYVIIGWVPLHFTFKLDGLYGFSIGAKVCFISMVASADVTPNVGLVVSGSAAISIFVAEAGIRVDGTILNTHVPIQPALGFKKFPLALRLRVDLVIIPLKVSVHIYLKISIHLFFVHFTKTIIDIELFHWSSPAITVNLFDISNLDKDNSPPLFSPITGSARRRRALSGATPCTVTQVAGRDYTNPAFILQISVADDKSQAELTYSVGTNPGGTDEVKDERMNGNTVLIARTLTSGIPLYWTASASNSQGVSASTQCSLNSYDMTPPKGRVDFDSYIYSSHPSKLIGKATIIDDTNLLNQSQAIGYGRGAVGDQTVPFTPFDFDQFSLQATSDNSITDFITIEDKKLSVTPFKTMSDVTLSDCSKDCISFPTKCFSFNYAVVLRVCQLLDAIGADSDVEFASNNEYSYYEKKGIGNHATFKYDNLPLVHDTLYFLNLYIVNQLLYESFIYSTGMLIDFTMPEPGVIRNASMNETRHDGCSAAFNKRCGPPEYITPLEYHRIIQDGPGSECVFNGYSVETDLEYTRLNNFVSVTFQGFHDNQSGIFAYAWYMGYKPCEAGALAPRDPNADSTSPLSDINQGRILRHFKDGIYYITVQALNQVIFGGSGVLTLCHSTPYIIDTTPPVIYNVTLIAYNENTNISTFYYHAWDNLSGLKLVELGAGLTINDISILVWTPIFTNRTATLTHKIDVPDGHRSFIRLRATNHVDLVSTSFAPHPIIVDRSPPIPGDVYDGDGPGNTDWVYQASGSVLCAKWRNFIDPESGISAYRWGAGTAPGLSDTAPFTDNLSPDTESYCGTGLDLKHDTVYFSTVIAFNSDTDHPRNISASSNGVLVDLTNPVAGIVKDGLDINSNLHYTHKPTTVQAVWDNFSDPESHMAQYNATIYSAVVLKYLPAQGSVDLNQKCPAIPHSNNTVIPIKPPFIPPSDVKFTITEDSVSVGLNKQLNWKHFDFSHGNYVKTTVTGIDGATRTTDVTSQGFLVDLTPPKIIQLYDGPNPQLDEVYQTSIKQLSASWIMVDPESGILEYRLSVTSTIQGSTSHFYPPDSPDIKIQPQEIGESGVLACWSDDILLSSGTLYTIIITPVNRAELSTIYTSSGITPDDSPPVMEFIHIDTHGDESEEKTEEDAVEIGNSGGIPVQWSAADPESGIAGFKAAVGTTRSGTDVSGYKLYPAAINVRIPAQLQLYENNTNIYYYVTVRAVNGAGLESTPVVSTKIKVLKANVAGVVTVGHSGVGISGEYQVERDTVTLTFEGFSSELCGIQYYEWSIGTTFAEDQVQVFSTAGIVDGAEGAGVAQALIPLELGDILYTEVRAVTACSGIGQQSTINSFGHGITVDWTAPLIVLTGLGQRTNGSVFENPKQDEKIYQYNPSTLVAYWNANDPQSGIYNFRYQVGTRPFSDDVTKPKITFRSKLTSNNVDPNQSGKPNILHITTFNRAGVYTYLIAPGITIDTLIPNIKLLQFNCTPYALNTTSSLTCHWHGAFDHFSEIVQYELMLGESEVDGKFYSECFDSGTLKVSMDNFKTPLTTRNLIYTLSVINSVGLTNYAFATLVVDNTPPVSGSVSVLIDQTTSSFLRTGKLNSTFSYQNLSSTTQCKTVITNIRVKWEEFTDLETPMAYYQIGIGEKRGQINIMNYRNVSLVTEHFLMGIDLSPYPVVYVIIRGFNRVGLIQVANSQPIYISPHDPKPAYVYDGSRTHDLQAQTGTSYLEAYWNFYDYCPGVNYTWAIFYMNQTVVQNYTNVTTTDSSNDNLALVHDTRVYVIVHLVSPLGYIRSARSDGITVQVEPLIPGVVYDGPFPGVDFNHQASLHTLMANWNLFGGVKPQRLSQKVIQYELALGTAARGPDRFNVVSLHSVYLNTSVTLSNLTLQINTQYYVTVEATSATLSTVMVTSNGIEPIMFDGIVQPGIVQIPMFQSVTKFLSITWKGFTSLLPIVSYEYAISTDDKLAQFSCQSFDNAANPLSEYFNVKQYTRSKSSSSVGVSGLQLKGATKYYAYVRVIDDSFQCNCSVSNPVVIDTTPPVIGRFRIGFDVSSLRSDYTQLQISYITTKNTLTVSWVGFYDPESSISNYQIALVERDDCDITSCDEVSEQKTTINNVTTHTFYVLDILAEKFYFVALRAINRAGLTSCAVSQPIKLDLDTPNQAMVKHGSSWKWTPPYQGSTTTMKGILALVRDELEAVCTDRMYNQSSPDTDWITITQSVTPTLPVGPDNPTGRTLAYSPAQALFNTGGAFLEISMTRDIQQYRMISAAAVTEMSVVSFNEMSVRIRSAASFQAVTSVLVWDGPETIIEDYEVLSSPDNDTQSNSIQTLQSSSCRYLPPPNPTPIPYKAFGLQIHPPANSTFATALLWYRGVSSGEMAHVWITLDFDPSAEYHTYNLKLEKIISTTPSTIKQATWSVLLKVDSHFLGSLVDLPQFESSLHFALHVRNYDGRVEPFASPFFPPTTSAYFTDITLPVDNSRVCKYGTPFYSEIAPFVKFEVGVGRSYGATNVSAAAGEEYQFVPLPCIPCNPDCSEVANSCDTSCDATVYYIDFEATGLELESGCTHPFNQTNTTCTTYSYEKTGIPEDQLYRYNLTFVPYVYYMKVRGYTGAGHVTYGYSRGIQIDPTPPNCTVIQHMQRDLRSNLLTNTTVQYSTNSLAVQYICSDTRSDIYGYEIAYSDNVEDISSLQFSSVGTDSFVNITNLDLNPQLIYYVVVRATNGAGLTTILTSDGVRILNKEPDVSRAVLTPSFSTQIDTLMSNTSISSSLTSLGLGWIGFYKTEYTKDPVFRNQTLFWKVGSEFGSDDILPTFEINFLQSHSIRIEGINVIGNSSFFVSNVTNLARSANKTDYNYTQGDLIMQVEPGRILYQTLILCAIQPRCLSAGTDSVTFYRSTTTTSDKHLVYASTSSSNFVLSFTKGNVEYPSGSNGPYIPTQLYPTNFKIHFSDDLEHNSGFMYGDLSLADMSKNYYVITAPTSSPYIPYIANPSSTLGKVERFLFSRVQQFLGPAFFVSPIGGADFPSWLKIETNFNLNRIPEGMQPILTAWNPDKQKWVPTRSSCNFTHEDSITSNTLTTYFCPCEESTERCNKPWQFILILADSDFVDTPPVPDPVPCIAISENSGTIQHTLSYTDAQDDTVEYSITSVVFTQANSEYLTDVPPSLNVVINDSVLYMTPCDGCFGNATVQYKITETGTPALLANALSASDEFTVQILGINTSPVLLMDNNNEDTHVLTLYREENDSIASITITVYSYDVDNDDRVHFSYLNCTHCELLVRETNPSDSSLIPKEYKSSSSSSSVNYTADTGYYGSDRMGVVAVDRSGAYSVTHLFSIFVRFKPCLNNAACKGPVEDPNCDTLFSPENFTEDYSCECTPRWALRRCDTVNKCFAQPCPYNTTCVVKENGDYECLCESEWPCSQSTPHTLTPGETAAVVISLLIAVLVIAGVILVIGIYLKKRRTPKTYVILESIERSKLDVSESDDHVEMVDVQPLQNLYYRQEMCESIL